MIRRVALLVAFTAVGFVFVGPPAKAQAQSFAGKWVHSEPNGRVSVLEFFPGEKHVIGPVRGHFHHSTVLDDGRVVEGDGSYVFRSVLPSRGWLVLHFSDGHVTREHELIIDSNLIRIEHHGVARTYVRQ